MDTWTLHPHVIIQHLISKPWTPICCYDILHAPVATKLEVHYCLKYYCYAVALKFTLILSKWHRSNYEKQTKNTQKYADTLSAYPHTVHVALLLCMCIYSILYFFNQNVMPIHIHWVQIRAREKWMAHTCSPAAGGHTYRENGKKERQAEWFTLTVILECCSHYKHGRKNVCWACGSVSFNACMSPCVRCVCAQTHKCMWASAPSHRGSLAYTSPS